IAERAAALIGHAEAERMRPRLLYERTMQRLHRRFPELECFRLQLLYLCADLGGGCSRRQWWAVAHGDLQRDDPAHFEERAPPLEAEDAARHAFEVHWDYGRVHVLHDPLHPTAEGKQPAQTADLALGKDADQLATADALARLAQRPHHLARTLIAGDGDCVEQ